MPRLSVRPDAVRVRDSVALPIVVPLTQGGCVANDRGLASHSDDLDSGARNPRQHPDSSTGGAAVARAQQGPRVPLPHQYPPICSG